MSIHQVNIAHQPLEDRLLLRVSTTDAKEFRIWLTRRFTQVLWKALIRLIEADAEVLVGREVRAKQEVLSFQHQQAIQQTNFAQQYNAKEQERPLGDLPLLASRLKVEKKDQKKYQVSIHDDSGQGIQLSLNQKLIHSICKLLADTSDKADWKLNLKLAGSTPSKDQRDQSSSIVH